MYFVRFGKIFTIWKYVKNTHRESVNFINTETGNFTKNISLHGCFSRF